MGRTSPSVEGANDLLEVQVSRIYLSCMEMVREVERDLWEMGINVEVQSMQDKQARFMTKEVRAYSFSIVPSIAGHFDVGDMNRMVDYVFPNSTVVEYCEAEIKDRTSEKILNPGNSHKVRNQVWSEFLHDGKFAYTYSERITPQLMTILKELRDKPGTRQAIINIHSNFFMTPGSWSGNPDVGDELDLDRIGGKKRIPCSMYYQLMRRNEALELIYTMRSCDYLTHFPVDIWLAIAMQEFAAGWLGLKCGPFHYFTGSLHAYEKDMKARGIF